MTEEALDVLKRFLSAPVERGVDASAQLSSRLAARVVEVEEELAAARTALQHMEDVAYERLNLFTTARADVEGLRQSVYALEELVLERTRERDTARAALAAYEALLSECHSHILAAGHLSPRCEYHGVCRCDMEDLLQRIEAALGEKDGRSAGG